VTSNDACEASEQLIALTSGNDKSDLVISIIACCHSVKLCALTTTVAQCIQAGFSDYSAS